jgi:hypothetical protein
VRQCPLSLEKWKEFVVGPNQIVLGLIIDTNRMSIRITDKSLQKVNDLMKETRNKDHCFFDVPSMQKFVGKLEPLSEDAPWICKLKLHLYTSLAFALKSNKQLLKETLNEFKVLGKQIKTKSFSRTSREELCRLSSFCW